MTIGRRCSLSQTPSDRRAGIGYFFTFFAKKS